MEALAFEVVPSVILMHTLVENTGHSEEVTVSVQGKRTESDADTKGMNLVTGEREGTNVY